MYQCAFFRGGIEWFERFFFEFTTLLHIPMHDGFYCLMILHHFQSSQNQFIWSQWGLWHWSLFFSTLSVIEFDIRSRPLAMTSQCQTIGKKTSIDEQLGIFFFTWKLISVGEVIAAVRQNSIFNDKWRLTLGKFLPSIDFKTASHGSSNPTLLNSLSHSVLKRRKGLIISAI